MKHLKAKRKPRVVSYFRFRDGLSLPEWIQNFEYALSENIGGKGNNSISIEVGDRVETADVGDYIIQLFPNYLYVCTPSEFKELYEVIEE